MSTEGATLSVNDQREYQFSGQQQAGQTLLQVAGLAAAHGDIEVLHNVSFQVGAGEGVVVVGRNGAGKSTLINVLAGLHPAKRGRIIFDGQDIAELDAVARVNLGIATVIGGDAVFGSLTVEENLRAFAHRVPRSEVNSRVEAAFETLPTLADRRRNLASTLSGGQQQQLGLARAVISAPRLLLIDEPTLGLAPAVAAQVLERFRSFHAQGIAMVISDESLVCCESAQRAVLIRRGEVVGEHSAEDLRHHTDLLAEVFDLDTSEAGF